MVLTLGVAVTEAVATADEAEAVSWLASETGQTVV